MSDQDRQPATRGEGLDTTDSLEIWEGYEKPKDFSEMIRQWGLNENVSSRNFKEVMWGAYLLVSGADKLGLVDQEEWDKKVTSSSKGVRDPQEYLKKLSSLINKMIDERGYPIEWFIESVGGYKGMSLVLEQAIEIVEDIKERNNVLVERASKAERELDDLIDEEGKNELRLRIQGLERSLALWKERSQKEGASSLRSLESQIDLLRKSKEKIEERFARERDTREKLAKESTRLGSLLADKGSALIEARGELASVKIARDGLKFERDGLLGEVLRLQEEIRVLQGYLDMGEKKLKEIFREMQEMKTENAEEIASKNAENKELKRQVEELTLENEALRARLSLFEDANKGSSNKKPEDSKKQ